MATTQSRKGQMNYDWGQKALANSEGIIAGCTHNQEWLLPWWWINLRLHNCHPITFVNFGDLSEKALDWCQQRGNVVTLSLQDDFVASTEQINPKIASLWESIHPEVWRMRLAWFKKPFALLQSPYERSLWLDLDCQVRGSLNPLFEMCKKDEIAMKREEDIFHELDLARGLLLPNEIVYNAGVIAFRRTSIIQTWAQQAVERNHLFIGDQQLLARILFMQTQPVTPLPDIYNWRADLGLNPEAVILHWLGNNKKHVQKQIEQLSQYFLIDLQMR